MQNRWEQSFFIALGPIVGSGDGCRPIPNTQAGGRVERVHEDGAKTDSGDYHCGQGNHDKAHLAFLSEVRSEVRSTRYDATPLANSGEVSGLGDACDEGLTFVKLRRIRRIEPAEPTLGR